MGIKINMPKLPNKKDFFGCLSRMEVFTSASGIGFKYVKLNTAYALRLDSTTINVVVHAFQHDDPVYKVDQVADITIDVRNIQHV
jgi:hypothetical protein